MSYWRLYYHVVWATKGRAEMIDADREAVLRRAFQSTCTDHGAHLHAVGVMPDHVHLAVSIPPKIAVSNFMAAVKSSATYLLNRQPDAAAKGVFAWQAEYGILSFSERNLPDVVAYVTDQRQRHAADTLYPGLERLDRRDAPQTPIPDPSSDGT